MEPIYHLVEPAAWEANPAADYAVASLDSEGFIHCAFAPQVALAANRFYPDASALLVAGDDEMDGGGHAMTNDEIRMTNGRTPDVRRKKMAGKR